MSPDVCVSRCHTRIVSAARAVTGAAAIPWRYTRRSPNDGMNFATGSKSESAPSS